MLTPARLTEYLAEVARLRAEYERIPRVIRYRRAVAQWSADLATPAAVRS